MDELGRHVAGPRYSIIAGDFASDTRADLAHFRVIAVIGRHTDAHGWCRLKQITIGTEGGGLSRETVNRKLKDLVAWGYVEKRAHDATGRAIWYRTIMDRGDPPSANVSQAQTGGDDDGNQPDIPETHGSDAPVRDGSHVGYNTNEHQGAELHPTCDRSDHTRCDRTQSHQNDPFLTTEGSPLNPRGAGNKVDRLIGDVTARGADGAVMARLIVPMLRARRFSSASPADALCEAARAAKGIPGPALDKALDLLLKADVKTIKAARLMAAIDAVRKNGAMVPIKAGTAQWARWLAYFDKQDPRQATWMRKFETWQVHDHWPPGNSDASLKTLSASDTTKRKEYAS